MTFQYSSLGYMVASTLPAELYGIPFDQYVQHEILTPLGMGDTTFDTDFAARTGRRSDGFIRQRQHLPTCGKEGGIGLGRRSCHGTHANIGFGNLGEGRMKDHLGIISSTSDMVSRLVCEYRRCADT
jgi:CubicO group peptidase (beta-lactamase class C family)